VVTSAAQIRRAASAISPSTKNGLAVADMTKSAWVYRKLRNFRAGIFPLS
jgi:hypothetical protein